MLNNHTFHKLFSIATFVSWGVIICFAAIWLGQRLANGGAIDADIMSLMPETQTTTKINEAVDRIVGYGEKKQVFLVFASTSERARALSEEANLLLVESHLFDEIEFRVSDELGRSMGNFYFPYRYNLLSDNSREMLQNDSFDAILEHMQVELLSPFSAINSAMLQDDPLLLFWTFMRENFSSDSSLVLDDGLLSGQSGGKTYVFISGQFVGSPYSLQNQEAYSHLLKALQVSIGANDEDAGIISIGAMDYAIAGTNAAKREVSTVGLGSLLGAFLLLVVIFRSLLPCALSLVSIACGWFFGLVACLYAFGTIHILTLVCGASLVGIAIDYSLHFFAQWFQLEGRWSAYRTLALIFPGITIGLITSLIGLSAFLLTPFAGLQQIAVFTGIGLISSYITVLAWYPLLNYQATPRHRPVALSIVRSMVGPWLRMRKSKVWLVPLSAILAITVYGVLKIRVDDDIRSFQSISNEVALQERIVSTVTGSRQASQFFLISADTIEGILLREEALIVDLDSAIEDGQLGDYFALSRFVPSKRRQRENYELQAEHVYGSRGSLKAIADQFGYDEDATAKYIEEFRARSGQYLSFHEWWDSRLSEQYRHLLFTDKQGGFSSVVMLEDLQNRNAIAELAADYGDISFVDHVDDISRVLGKYREQSSILIAVSYVIIFLFLTLRYNVRRAAMIMLPPLLSVLITLAVFGFLDRPVNLFTVVAFLLVMGIGVDYTIFFQEGRAHWDTTALAILLSAITTSLAFGLLSLSSTHVIQSFGLTILIGISITLVLSPIVLIGDNHKIDGTTENRKVHVSGSVHDA